MPTPRKRSKPIKPAVQTDVSNETDSSSNADSEEELNNADSEEEPNNADSEEEPTQENRHV